MSGFNIWIFAFARWYNICCWADLKNWIWFFRTHVKDQNFLSQVFFLKIWAWGMSQLCHHQRNWSRQPPMGCHHILQGRCPHHPQNFLVHLGLKRQIAVTLLQRSLQMTQSLVVLSQSVFLWRNYKVCFAFLCVGPIVLLMWSRPLMIWAHWMMPLIIF